MPTLESLSVTEQNKLTQCEYRFELEGDIDQFRDHPEILSPYTDITPLIYACLRGDLILVRELIAQGADIEKEGGDPSRTPLMFAAADGNADVLDVLIEQGANPNAETTTLFGQKIIALNIVPQSAWFGFWPKSAGSLRCETSLRKAMEPSLLNQYEMSV